MVSSFRCPYRNHVGTSWENYVYKKQIGRPINGHVVKVRHMTELVINSLIILQQQASGSNVEAREAVRKKRLTFSIKLHSFNANSHIGVRLTLPIIFQQSQLFCSTVVYNIKEIILRLK